MFFEKTHFRVCHVCGSLNAAQNGLVHECENCGKQLAPFYFFDESRALGLKNSSGDSSQVERLTSSLPLKEYPPVWGLTAYWE
jgi:predicted RNA-binding Zn-ribbon protein involved in translation (DUF1610 family)